jgi:hypothetical protein
MNVKEDTTRLAAHFCLYGQLKFGFSVGKPGESQTVLTSLD